MLNIKSLRWLGAFTFIILFSVTSLHGQNYTFLNITNNNAGDAAIGEAQLFCDVTEVIEGSEILALFTFTNIGPEASSICDIYIDDGSLLGIASINNVPGSVEFTENPTPPNLPGWDLVNPNFYAIRAFSVDSDPPVQPMGVNPGEVLSIKYDLINGGTYADVLSELADGTLRIGIHVQGFASEGSESFIMVPEPATLCLLTIGGLTLLRRRRN